MSQISHVHLLLVYGISVHGVKSKFYVFVWRFDAMFTSLMCFKFQICETFCENDVLRECISDYPEIKSECILIKHVGQGAEKLKVNNLS